MAGDFGLSDAELFPLLDDAGREMLRGLREHPHAPRYNWRNGERLDAAGLKRVREFAARVPQPWSAEQVPSSLLEFFRSCRRDVPFYRQRADWPDDFHALPITRRSDIRRAPWAFVPDWQRVDDLVVYSTSGTSGSRLLIPATPELPARYLPLFERALSRVGVKLAGGNRVSIVQICAQHGTVVLCSVSSYLNGAGFVKINLDPADWNDPDDRDRFLNDCNPELLTGDPFALCQLMQLPVTARPKAIISAGTGLPAGLRSQFSRHFGCPVIDMYSMNESGPVAFSFVDGIHEIAQPGLFVEVLDERGEACAPGTRGEITLTGGLNQCLPLVRYATGDFAAMQFDSGAMPKLIQFAGRAPVAFRTASGNWISSVDISTALLPIPLSYLSLHQHADGKFTLRTTADQELMNAARDALIALLGSATNLEIINEDLTTLPGKPIAYSSDLPMPTGASDHAAIGAASA